MMQQYNAIKAQYQDCFLLYRLGDFYELFGDDAAQASHILGITLTKRGEIPMAGIPFHAAESYIKKLLDTDAKIAICEQMESPQPGQKGPVKREVVRILTPGTVIENLTDSANYLAVFSPTLKDKIGVALCDLSTGFLRTEICDISQIESIIAKYQPTEVITPDSLQCSLKRTSRIPDSRFNYDNCLSYLKKHFKVETLDVFGFFEKSEVQAAGFLIDYLFITQKRALEHIKSIHRLNESEYMFLNATTRQSLELMETTTGKKEGSLIHTLSSTKTAAGKRLLIDRINNPVMNPTTINQRLDQIEFFIKHPSLITSVRHELKSFPDIERCITRLSLGRGTPKDLKSLEIALSKAMSIGTQIQRPISEELKSLYHQLMSTLKDEVPVAISDFVKSGISESLDHYRNLQSNAATLIQDLEDQYKRETDIPNLRIKLNNIWGYFVEVTSSHTHKVPAHFILKQTLSSGHRYITEALANLQSAIQSAEASIQAEEVRIFKALVEDTMQSLTTLQELASKIAHLDLASSMAHLAIEKNYVRPLVDESDIFNIQAGRHPALDHDFIPNDCHLDGMHIITGPNMGGKSTYLRQNALITIMAQAGLYVPCSFAHIGVIDKVMTRIGASDDISKGRSTFMVEMIETSAILHNATSKSLVILDEIGRGTSTSDGLAIAFSVCQHLLEHNQSKVLFATHYHELAQLNHPKVQFYHVATREWNNTLVFLHTIEKGFCDRSYGIHVAELAGFPQETIERAKKFAYAKC